MDVRKSGEKIREKKNKRMVRKTELKGGVDGEKGRSESLVFSHNC